LRRLVSSHLVSGPRQLTSRSLSIVEITVDKTSIEKMKVDVEGL